MQRATFLSTPPKAAKRSRLATDHRRRTADDIQPHPGRRMSEAEFVAWVGGKTRAEWVDGEVIVMSPVSREQGDLCVWLIQVLGLFVKANDVGVALAPEFMVRLPRQRRRRVPDILFVAKDRLDLLRPNHLEGAPDLALEIVGPDSVSRDWRDKYNEYEKAGVKEYWIVDPMCRKVEAYALGRRKKYRQIDEADGMIASGVLPGFYLEPEWVVGQGQLLASPLRALKELGVKL